MSDMKRLQDTEYMYASSRVRALENRLVGRERMEALIEARNADEVLSRLAEYGLTVPTDEAAVTPEQAEEQMLLGLLRDAYRESTESVPDPAVFRYFRYPYDCNNLKVALKCLILGSEPDGLLFDFGTVPAGDVMEMVREGNYKAFPAALADAAPRAREAYDKSGDPRRLDTILDRACYDAMLADAAATGEDALVDWVRTRVDLTNLITCLRIIRMRSGAVGLDFLQDALLSGGTLDERFFSSVYEGGEESWRTAVAATRYAQLAEVDGEPAPLYVVERCADDLWLARVREDARIPFGAAVIAGYLAGCEVSVKNIRMILAAKRAGLTPEVIRGRVRASYV